MKTIVLTAGEPAGIGPDLCVFLAQNPPSLYRLVIVGDPLVLCERAKCLGLSFPYKEYQKHKMQHTVEVLPISYPEKVTPGRLDPKNMSCLISGLDRAISGCLNQEFNALVTNPISKSTIQEAGISFLDHTNHLQKKCSVSQVVMTFISKTGWCVSLMTTHLPLQAVSSSLSQNKIIGILHIINHDFSCYWLKKPYIAVCGLNPHAGESGYLGREEIEIISPALFQAQKEGINCQGPLPADTLFPDSHRKAYDVILACYHDQGLIPFKAANFPGGTNTTLGLPIIRTSVDHGIALDKAGTGAIDCHSLTESIHWAYTFSLAKERYGDS